MAQATSELLAFLHFLPSAGIQHETTIPSSGMVI